eukprot:8164233-Alexandrium_andersonii.AAC.1
MQYVLNFKNKLFKTDNHKGYNCDLARLVLACANNHAHAMDDRGTQETILESCSADGGGINR